MSVVRTQDALMTKCLGISCFSPNLPLFHLFLKLDQLNSDPIGDALKHRLSIDRSMPPTATNLIAQRVIDRFPPTFRAVGLVLPY